jgi:hypothetical protein
MAINVTDTGGNNWAMGANDDGTLVFSPLPSGASYATIVLRDWFFKVKSFNLNVVPVGGNIFLQTSPSTGGGYLSQTMISPGGKAISLIVDGNGIIYTMEGVNITPLVGQLLPGDGAYPVPHQAGGTGTPVTTWTNTPGEKTGKFYPACGHSINSWDIHFLAAQGIPSAFICCPQCLYIQKILTPASQLYSQANQIIIA